MSTLLSLSDQFRYGTCFVPYTSLYLEVSQFLGLWLLLMGTPDFIALGQASKQVAFTTTALHCHDHFSRKIQTFGGVLKDLGRGRGKSQEFLAHLCFLWVRE